MISCSDLLNKFQDHLIYTGTINHEILDREVSNISNNSKKIKTNGIFFAINDNSLKYIDDVIFIMPSLIIIDISFKDNLKITHIIQNQKETKVIFSHDINIRKLYGLFVTRFYNLERFPLKIVAVTGTNGKSSSTFFYKQLCNFTGIKSCSIGTIGIYSDDAIGYEENNLTAPDISDLCEIIFRKASNGILDFAIEASSHGLDQYRLDEIPLEAVGFTNFTQDHLDYHKNLENYWNAKKRLFSELIKNNKKIVINNDDPKSIEIKNICLERGIQYITIGIKEESDIQILNYHLTENLTYNVELSLFDRKCYFEINILGEFQLYNLIIAIGLFYCTHKEQIELIFFQDGGGEIKNLKAPPGRMETIQLNNKNNSIVIIDYAHSPDGLENLLISSKKLLKGQEKILLIFGCGGNREKEKRSIMGQIAEKYSDLIIITDDNPRNENPEIIRKEIMSGIKNKNLIIEIGDRKKAIEYGISLQNNYKIIIIAGKGHEKNQIIGDKIINFDDKLLAESMINQQIHAN